MNTFWIIIIILIIAAPFALWFLKRRGYLQKILQAVGLGYSYRNVEKNVFTDMPERMPKEWKSPRGAKVHSESQPAVWEFELIDRAITEEVARFNLPFKNWSPPDAGAKAKNFKQHSDYRVWLLEHPTSIGKAESPEIVGFPIIKTSNSATGWASGITAGFRTYFNGDVKPIFPFIVVPRLTGEFANNEAARAYFYDSLKNEIQHLLASNIPQIWHYYTGERDIHPFEW